MICQNCGNYMPDDSAFCPNCGTAYSSEPAPAPAEPVYDPQPDYTNPGYGYQAPAPSPEESSLSTKILVFGIIALAAGGILGIIFGSISQKLAGEYESTYGLVYGKAKVGRILGKIGLIVGIVGTIIYAVYFIIYGAIMCGSIGNSYSNYSFYLINLFH